MIQPTCRNFDIYLHGKIWTPSLTSFLRYCKVLQTCYFEYFENTWSCPSIITEINLAEINFAVYLLAKKSISSPTFSLRYCKDIANLVFWELWESLTIPIKTIVLICRKPSCSSSCKKSTSSTTSFIRYYNEIVNLLFCVLWDAWLWHSKWCYQLVANSCVYLQAKKQLHRPCFSGDIAKIYKLKTKTTDKIFQKIQRISFWCHEKWALSLFRYYKFLLSCKISQKSNDSFLRRIPNWWMDRQTDGRTVR